MDDAESPPDWKPWFAEHGARLLLFARQQTRSEADAEDVLQDAILRLWRRASGAGGAGGRDGDGPHRPAPPDLPLVFKTIRRAAIDHARREDRRARREERAALDPAGAGADPGGIAWFERPVESTERQDLLREAVRQLPPAQQEVLTLKVWGGLTFEQVAGALDLSPNTAASRYRYALANLKKQLDAVAI